MQVDTVLSRSYEARTVKTLRTLPGASSRTVLGA